MGVRLPAEYQEVEYLENTDGGTQRIDVGFPITDTLSIELAFYTVTTTSSMYYMGRYIANNGEFFLYNSGGTFQTAYGCPYGNTSVSAVVHKKHIFVFAFEDDRAIVKENGIIIANAQKYTPLRSDNNISIAGTSMANSGAIRTYSFKTYNGTNKVADFVPCYRKTDSKPGMYDLVTKQFFTNQGEGEFLVGPDVIDSISPLMVAWRRMLMRKYSPIPTGYVTDGLLLWLDAKCNTRQGHDENSLYWEDLSENHRDYAIGESGLIFGQSVVSFTTANHKPITTEKGFTDIERTRIKDNLATIEIGVNFTGSGYQIVLPLSSQHGTINFYNMGGRRILNFSPTNTSESVSLLYGLHGYNSELWVDGVKQESVNYSTTWTTICRDMMFAYVQSGNAYSFLGDIAYIRVYNRRLTDAELMQNWLRDKARYNL